jgi:hypothetical protein
MGMSRWLLGSDILRELLAVWQIWHPTYGVIYVRRESAL